MAERVKVIVNRAGLEKAQISHEKAEQTIGGEIFARIPNNYSIISECRNNGLSLLEQAPKAAITQQIVELAEKLSGDSYGSTGRRRRRQREEELAELSVEVAFEPKVVL